MHKIYFHSEVLIITIQENFNSLQLSLHGGILFKIRYSAQLTYTFSKHLYLRSRSGFYIEGHCL